MTKFRDYEVSIWSLQDEFISVLKPIGIENIGQLENKELQLKTDDGVNQYSCSIPMYIYMGKERIENPIWYNTTNGNIISNMRKIKVILNKATEVEEVYEFLIIKVEERHDKDQLYCDITCEDLAFHELGKQGYKISLSTDVFYDEYNKWAEEDGNETTKPRGTIQHWLNQFLEPLAAAPLSTKWYYSLEMNWDSLTSEERDNDKIYEEEYVSSWDADLIAQAVVTSREKERLVDLQESNIFNLTQELAKVFEVFVKYKYLYDSNYHIIGRRIIFYNNYIREEEGYLDITYPYGTSAITRTIDAADVTTKMYVRPVTEDTTESGLLTIMNVDANKTKEDYLLNFEYLYTIGAITQEQYNEIPNYEKAMRNYNTNLENLKSYIDVLELDINKLEATKTILTNSRQLDLERIQEAQDLLNSLDAKDLDIDGAITIGQNNPSTAVLIPQENSNKYYINISEPGVLRETLHIFTTYQYVGTVSGSRLRNEISGTFIDDEFGNLIQIRDLEKPQNAISALVYLTFKYVPKLKYEQVEKIWNIRLGNDEAKLAEVTDTITDKIEELETKKEQYEVLLEEKKQAINAFDHMMGAALRESYWQPEDYKVNGDNFHDTFTIPSTIISPIGASNHTQFIWDEELFDEEQKGYYEISVLEQPIYYPCIDISRHLDYVLENYDRISFMFYDYIADDTNRYQLKYLKHFALGSQAEFVFVKVGSTVKPAIILIGAKTISLNTLRNMINSRQDYNPKIGTYSLEEGISEGAFEVEWLNLNDIQQVGRTRYNIQNAEQFESWVEAKSGYADYNLEIIGLIEHDVWSPINLCYPRIQVDSMLLKNDETLVLQSGSTLLNNYEDYYLLTRMVEDGEAYAGNYFLTIKPKNIVFNETLDFYFTLSNAQTAIYLDARMVLKENAYPKVTYSLDVSLVQDDFHYTLYRHLNRIANINDTDLKLQNVQGYISGITIDLDKPSKDKIEIKNYRNKFEDLFSSIVAQTEAMKKNEFIVGLAATSFTPLGALAPEVLQQSINNVDLEYAFNQGSLTIDEENGIWATSDDGVVAMRGGGIFTATKKDNKGNWQWNTGILPSGINADLITTGQLDTNLIRIYAGNKLKFQLNGEGLYAYKSIFDDDSVKGLLEQGQIVAGKQTSITEKLNSQNGLDLSQYVVHNDKGLFLVAEAGSIVKNANSQLTELDEDIKRVEISWDGLKLRNWNNDLTFYADPDTGDLTLRGRVEATSFVLAGETDRNLDDYLATNTTQYFASSSVDSILRSYEYIRSSTTRTPYYSVETLTINCYSQYGSARNNYAGRIKIERTTNGSTWITVYDSIVNESTCTYRLNPDNSTIAYRYSLYKAGSFTTLLDSHIIAIADAGQESAATIQYIEQTFSNIYQNGLFSKYNYNNHAYDVALLSSGGLLVAANSRVDIIGNNSSISLASGNITMTGGNIALATRAGTGGNISLTGGNISMTGGQVNIEGGEINLTSGGGTNEISLSSTELYVGSTGKIRLEGGALSLEGQNIDGGSNISFKKGGQIIFSVNDEGEVVCNALTVLGDVIINGNLTATTSSSPSTSTSIVWETTGSGTISNNNGIFKFNLSNPESLQQNTTYKLDIEIQVRNTGGEINNMNVAVHHSNNISEPYANKKALVSCGSVRPAALSTGNESIIYTSDSSDLNTTNWWFKVWVQGGMTLNQNGAIQYIKFTFTPVQ